MTSAPSAVGASADHPTLGFPVVGIGASAGGMEAFTRFLQHLPADTGMAFVLVQHLDPTHESALSQILAKATSLPLEEITQDLRLERNHVYVIPPNTSLGIEQGVLKLGPRPTGPRSHRSIDSFFEALAQDQRECAIGIILSGTATDGTMGLEAIKAEGGLTFAQDETAKHDSMPRSAIAAGCVDFVLRPEKIAEELGEIARHPMVAGQSLPPAKPAGLSTHRPENGPVGEEGDAFKRILYLLREHSGVDFSCYKTNTIQRRIRRRMLLSKLSTLPAYARHLRGKSQELDALYSDVLISVTSLFRNADSFEFLQRKVFPQFLQERSDETRRVWVPACSSGQEAYSLAMAFMEVFDGIPGPPKLQIFASDLNEALLVKARAGFYAKALVQDVSPERLRRFFVEEDGGYRVIKPLRESIVFARQNLLSDPPFSRLDLISCRNVLIYIEASLQKKIIPTFHYALKPSGCLFLGASETIGTFTELFEPIDKKHRIYRKKTGPAPVQHFQRVTRQAVAEKTPPVFKSPRAREQFHTELNAQREADRITRNRYAPPAVLVNADLHVLEFRGDTSGYLKPPTGEPSFNLLKMAGDGLMLPLRALLKKVKKENRVVRRENVRVNDAGHSRMTHIEVVPLKNLKEQCYLVFFEAARKAEHAAAIGPAQKLPAKVESGRIRELETALAETRDYMQSVEEEHEASNEEVQSANEEITSANEELQSMNEELETSKEELESANEELTTVNDEMSSRNTDLSRLNNDLTNLQTSTRLPIVLLGRDLTIRRFSPSAAKQFNLVASDVGRSISAIRHNLVFPERGPQTASDSIGAKDPEHDRRRRNGNQTGNGSDAATKSIEKEPGFGVLEAGNAPPGSGSRKTPEDLEEFIVQVIDTVRERDREVRDQNGRWYSLMVSPYITLENKVDGAAMVLVDIDELKRTEQTVTTAHDYVANVLQTVREPLLVLDGDLRVESANRSFYRTFRVTPAESVGRLIFELGNRQWDIPRLRALLEQVLPKTGVLDNFEVERDFDKIGSRTMVLSARRIEDATGKTHRILVAIEDISQRKQLQQELQSARVAEAVIRTARDPLLILNQDLGVHAANAAFYNAFQAVPAETEGRSFFELSNRIWNTPRMRELLEDVSARSHPFDNVEVTHDFDRAGRRTFLLNARQMDDATRAPKRILLGMQDITELLQFQTELRRSELRFRRLFEAARDGVLLVDPETGKIVTANPFMSELLGRASDELLGKDLFEVGLIPDREKMADFFRELQENNCVRNDDLPLHTKGREERHVEMVSNLYREADEQIIQCNVRDITERKKTDRALQHAQATLADRALHLQQAVAERTAELSFMNRQLEAFVYSVAHDLRAPLRAMEAFTTYLVEEEGGVMSETGRNYAQRINRSAMFMDGLLSDLLDFSRLSLQQVELTTVDFGSVVRETGAQLENEIKERNARLELAGPWPSVRAHGTTLGQVLINLVSNALKFVAPDVVPVIRLRTEERGAFIRAWVEDNGIGIDPAHQQQIFGLFNRLHGERYPGTGIGLAIVQKGIERLGGQVGVESSSGQGSRFWFEVRKA